MRVRGSVVLKSSHSFPKPLVRAEDSEGSNAMWRLSLVDGLAGKQGESIEKI